ncbi:pilus assembly protein PilW [Ideonella sp. TBM-1]|uniref:Pilus assembly protein PilW n=1 Tax=Ideonella livida TaxID=2707176 RepID=A0A7C9TMV6_9BURK|nr:pilus assembly protein PilW [Ideonella livida]
MTLVELMIAMALGLVLALAMASLQLSVTRSSTDVSRTTGMLETARVVLQLMADDLSQAGFWGGYVPEFDNLTFSGVPSDPPTALPDPCLAYSATNWNATYLRNLFGVPALSGATAPGTCDTLVTQAQANSDVLVVRRVSSCAVGEAGCEATATEDALYHSVNLCSTVSTTHLLASTGHAALLARDCTTPAAQRRLLSSLWWVRDHAVSDGDGIPTLMRSSLGVSSSTPTQGAGEVVAEGVQALRVEWGIDNVSKSGGAVNFSQAVAWVSGQEFRQATNRGDGAPDGADVHCDTTTPCTVDQMSNAVTATLYVLVRSVAPVDGYTDTRTYQLGGATLGPFNDRFQRKVFSTTVRLANVSGRRETP